MLGSSSAGVALGIAIALYLAVIVSVFVGWWKILTKAGYSGAWVFIALVPLVNLVMYFVFAFSEWPVHEELRQARLSRATHGPPQVPPPPLSGSDEVEGPYSVILLKPGDNPRRVADAIVTYVGTNRHEANEMVSSDVPVAVVDNFALEYADALKGELERAGATVEVS